MQALTELWLPLLLSGVLVFIASSLIHMVFKWHAPDYHGLANEEAVRDAIRAGNPAPGLYVLPYCKEMKEMGSEAMLKKYHEGPVGFLTLKANGAPSMGVPLLQWFVYSLVISAIAAYLAVQAFGFAADHKPMAVHLIGVVSFLAYGFGAIQESIWKAETWRSTFKYVLDAAVYAVITALTFLWLWPSVS